VLFDNGIVEKLSDCAMSVRLVKYIKIISTDVYFSRKKYNSLPDKRIRGDRVSSTVPG
jgi:hypothetical protein